MLEQLRSHRSKRVERVGLALGAAGASVHLLSLAARLSARRFPALWDEPGDVAVVAGLASVVLLAGAWLLAMWINDNDDESAPGARRLWLVVLLVLNLYAGAAYFLSRAIRRRNAAGSVPTEA